MRALSIWNFNFSFRLSFFAKYMFECSFVRDTEKSQIRNKWHRERESRDVA